MERLEVSNGKIVTASGKPIALRGTCVGGWMNMENFINGYPGDESGTRWVMAQTLDPPRQSSSLTACWIISWMRKTSAL